MHETEDTQSWRTAQPWGMGWGGRREGVQDRGHMYTHGWFTPFMYGKNHNTVISLQLKSINLKKDYIYKTYL